MKTKNQTSKFMAFLAVSATLLFIAACEKEEPIPDYPAPSLTISETSLTMKPGESQDITMNISAEGGLTSIVVNKNGGLLEEVMLDDSSVTSYSYTILADSDAGEGDVLAYEFIGVNTQDTESEPVALDVSIAVYDAVDIEGTSVYQVDIPEGNTVADGTTIKFAKDRKYLLGGSLNFPGNTSLVVEEGVHIYFATGGDELLYIKVEGIAEINGTSSNPVVMTSDKELKSGEDAQPNDWLNFEIEGDGNGSNHGVIEYLRIEYAGDRAFRLDNVGNGTQISYVQVFMGDTEGVMVTDGDVNLKYILSTNTGDSNFRLGDAYSGMGQFLIANNTIQGEEAFYIREDSEVILANVTVTGPGKASGFENAGIRFRSSKGGKVYNAIVTALPDWGVRSDSIPTDIDGARVLAYSNVYDNDSRDDDFADVFFTETSFSNSEDPVAGITTDSFVPNAETASSFDPSSLDAFFTPASFKGAIQDGNNDWTKGWVRNPDGSIR
jgi:hypothetical protein